MAVGQGQTAIHLTAQSGQQILSQSLQQIEQAALRLATQLSQSYSPQRWDAALVKFFGNSAKVKAAHWLAGDGEILASTFPGAASGGYQVNTFPQQTKLAGRVSGGGHNWQLQVLLPQQESLLVVQLDSAEIERQLRTPLLVAGVASPKRYLTVGHHPVFAFEPVRQPQVGDWVWQSTTLPIATQTRWNRPLFLEVRP